MKFDRYYIFARVTPALLTSMPFILFNHFYINTELSGFLHTVASVQWVEEISMPLVFIFLLVFINRAISKMIIENKRYGGETKMPTTNILLFCNSIYSSGYKDKIHGKIYKDFGIKLLNKQQESKDEDEARKKIVEAVSQIRERVKGGRLLLQHNIEYGFFRNLVGGSVVGAIFSLFCILFFHFFYPSPLAFVLSFISTIIYFGIVLLHPWIIDWLGYIYAKRLIQEYM